VVASKTSPLPESEPGAKVSGKGGETFRQPGKFDDEFDLRSIHGEGGFDKNSLPTIGHAAGAFADNDTARPIN